MEWCSDRNETFYRKVSFFEIQIDYLILCDIQFLIIVVDIWKIFTFVFKVFALSIRSLKINYRNRTRKTKTNLVGKKFCSSHQQYNYNGQGRTEVSKAGRAQHLFWLNLAEKFHFFDFSTEKKTKFSEAGVVTPTRPPPPSFGTPLLTDLISS
jgi:hypothetical protein